jgi:DNA-binding transcriptional LysR family regulator
MDLLALSDFNLVATHGGFGRASRASGQPKATLSRRVRELEEEAAEDVRAGLGRPSGRLRVSVPLLFAHTTMGRLAAAFIAAFPDVQLEVTAEDRFTDLVADGYDLVVRVNPRPDDELVGRCFLQARLVLVAAASLARPAQGKSADLGPSVAAVMRTGASDAIWRVKDQGEELTFRPKAVLRFSSPLLVRDAVLAGAGVALLPRSVVADDLADGRIVSWGTATEGHIEAWVLHASRRLISPKVTAFVNFLCDYFPVVEL